ncbi:M24 family metallopeptidase [Mameliella sediminis]|uniref:M24 family metallopeptidase n=1 Tax=Mameliella sediminis TaxID=2836866 RepID=UPI001C493F36|nr:Xaa-Pro peptidase family protein [Mameliella sediminis]MBV7395607.1 Xaa-Pro peptidase family protein [Mameliella sediminis]
MTEHATRLANLEKAVTAIGLDAFLISTKDSIYYFTGFRYEPFERPFFIVVRPGQKPLFLTPRIEAENMATIAVPHDLVEYIDYPAPAGGSYLEALQSILPTGATVGVEMMITGELLVALSAWSPQVLPLVERLRAIKSPTEVNAIRRAATYSDRGLELAMGLAAVGRRISETDHANALLREEIIAAEGHLDPYTSSVWQGLWAAPFSAQPHRFPEPSDTLGAGPNVGLSFLRVNGYSAETERTFFVTQPSRQDAEVFETMVEAGRIGFAAIGPGVSCHDVDHKVMSFLRAEGFGDNLLHRTGHGIGMGGHEGPWVAEGSDDILQENMVISIEPGIYWRGQGGFRHSDTVLITADGYECLTHLPRDISAMTLTG